MQSRIDSKTKLDAGACAALIGHGRKTKGSSTKPSGEGDLDELQSDGIKEDEMVGFGVSVSCSTGSWVRWRIKAQRRVAQTSPPWTCFSGRAAL